MSKSKKHKLVWYIHIQNLNENPLKSKNILWSFKLLCISYISYQFINNSFQFFAASIRKYLKLPPFNHEIIFIWIIFFTPLPIEANWILMIVVLGHWWFFSLILNHSWLGFFVLFCFLFLGFLGVFFFGGGGFNCTAQIIFFFFFLEY